MQARIIKGNKESKVHHVSMGRNLRQAQVIVTDETGHSVTRHLKRGKEGIWRDAYGNLYSLSMDGGADA